MTRQEALNLNWNHFVVNQKPKCEDLASNTCQYSHQGNCCAVGVLLSPSLRRHLSDKLFPVEEMWAELEGTEHLAEYQRLEADLGLDFLEYLQLCHDSVITNPNTLALRSPDLNPQPVQFQKALQMVISRFGLDPVA